MWKVWRALQTPWGRIYERLYSLLIWRYLTYTERIEGLEHPQEDSENLIMDQELPMSIALIARCSS